MFFLNHFQKNDTRWRKCWKTFGKGNESRSIKLPLRCQKRVVPKYLVENVSWREILLHECRDDFWFFTLLLVKKKFNHKGKSINRKKKHICESPTRALKAFHSNFMSSSTLKTSLSCRSRTYMQELPLKMFSPREWRNERKSPWQSKIGNIIKRSTSSNGGKIFHVLQPFLVVLLILFPLIFVLLFEAIKHDSKARHPRSFLLKIWGILFLCFVVFALTAPNSGDCFVVVLFCRIFYCCSVFCVFLFYFFAPTQ